MSNEMKDYMSETNQEMLRAADDLRGFYPIGVCRMNGEIQSTVLILDPEVNGNSLRLNARLDGFTSLKVPDESREWFQGKHAHFIFAGHGKATYAMFPASVVNNDTLLNASLTADDRFLPGVDKEILKHVRLFNDRSYFPDEVEKLEQILDAAGLHRVPLEQVNESSLDKPLMNTSLNDLLDFAHDVNMAWAIETAEALRGMYPLGIVTDTDQTVRVAVLELDPTVENNMIHLNPEYTAFVPFTMEERDRLIDEDVDCCGIDVESESGQVWVLDDFTAWGDKGPTVLNRISSLADTLCPGINFGSLSRIRVPDDGIVTPDGAEELLYNFARAGLQKVEPEIVAKGWESCIWNNLHTSLNSAMDFYEEAERAAGRGEER